MTNTLTKSFCEKSGHYNAFTNVHIIISLSPSSLIYTFRKGMHLHGCTVPLLLAETQHMCLKVL